MLESTNGKSTEEFTFWKANQAVTLELRPTVKIKDEPVNADPQLIFQESPVKMCYYCFGMDSVLTSLLYLNHYYICRPMHACMHVCIHRGICMHAPIAITGKK